MAILNNILNKTLPLSTYFKYSSKLFSTTVTNYEKHSCKLLVVGGGTGGCAVAAKFSKEMSKTDLIILEPSKNHYYQPLFTLVGGGMHTLEDARRNEKDVLPKNSIWIQSKAVEYSPKENTVTAENGDVIEYDYLLIAVGLETNYEKISGLLDALSIPEGKVCSNYSDLYVNRTFTALKNLKSGNAIFTFPNSPVKCPGAPQKICYITDDYLRKNGKRIDVNIAYNTSLPVIFGVKRYADALWNVCTDRNIEVNLRTNLISIDPDKNNATFENLDTKEKFTTSYSMLHVTPPMSTPASLRNNKDLANEAGFVNVDKSTLQHTKFSNVFAIGDCGSTPNSKTAAAAAAQSNVVYKNMKAEMDKQKHLPLSYDGYASCPLVTGYNKCILAEFNYDLEPMETFPFRQDREMYSMFLLKKNVMPSIYWLLMMNGHWNGPAAFRDIMHLNLSNRRL